MQIKHWLARLDLSSRKSAEDQRLRFGTHELRLPAGHALPRILQAYPNYGSGLGRLAALVWHKYPGKGILDIGANVGDTVHLLRTAVDAPILCIEGHPRFLTYLARNCMRVPDVAIESVFVRAGSMTLRGTVSEHAGTASVRCDGLAEELPSASLTEILGRQPRFRRSKLWKVDTDGFDVPILRANMDLVADSRPILHFEYDPDLFRQNGEEGLALFEDLRRLRYRLAAFAENTGEYLLTASTDAVEQLEDLDTAQSGRNSLRYWDVSVFPEEDADIAVEFREKELAFWRIARR